MKFMLISIILIIFVVFTNVLTSNKMLRKIKKSKNKVIKSEATIHTSDGYFLTLFRCSKENTSNLNNKSPILLMHGILDSSDGWDLSEDPNKNLFHKLLNEGYDVWLGNNRGNKYSNGHGEVLEESENYWDFSLEEMGKYDIPAILSHIKEETKKDKVIIIGHSQGAAQVFALCSLEFAYCNKNIKGLIGLAPAVFISKDSKLIKKLLDFKAHNYSGYISNTHVPFGLVPLASHSEKFFTKLFNIFFHHSFNIVIEYFSDKSKHNNDQDAVKKYTKVFPSGASMEAVLHLAKNAVADNFLQRNSNENYPLENIQIPVYLHYGENDLLISPKGGEKLMELLSSVKEKEITVYKNMGHLTFLCSKGEENYIENVMKEVVELSN